MAATSNCIPESGVSLAGDVLACLVTAVRLHASQNKGPVYFLARDGWLPWQIMQGDVFGSYLSVSRIALRQPLMALNPAQAARWCIDPVSTNTPRSVLAKVDATPEELADTLRQGGFPESRWDHPMNGPGRRRLAALFVEPAFGVVLDRLREVKAPLVRSYLDQSGLLSCEQASVVDIGWNGSCHQHLQAWRSEAALAAESLGGIYLGLQSRSAFSKKTPLTAVWEPGQIGSTLFSHPSFYVLAEMFLTANHGGVVGYERSPTGRVEPLLAQHNQGVYDDWGLPGFHEAMIERALSRLGASEAELALLAKETAAAFLAFASRPSRQDSVRFGQWPACVDAAHGEGFPLAPKMTIPEMWNFFVYRQPQPVLWMEAAEARLEGFPLWVFKLGRRLDSWVGRLRIWASRLGK